LVVFGCWLLVVGVAVCLDLDHFGLFLDAVCWLLVLLFAWILINFGYFSLLFAVYGSCCLLGL